MRQLFNVLLLSLSLQSLISFAANEGQEIPNPVIDVKPYINKDKSAVFVFFKFNCPACRAYHPSLEAWGRSLPKGISFQFLPILESGGGKNISDESLIGAQAFWVSERLGNSSKIGEFADDAYSLSQDDMAGNNKDRWFDLLTARRYAPKNIVSAWKSEISLGASRYERQMHYDPHSTPTLLVCGKWMISPDSANGDRGLFTQLANGLVSRCAEELGLDISKH